MVICSWHQTLRLHVLAGLGVGGGSMIQDVSIDCEVLEAHEIPILVSVIMVQTSSIQNRFLGSFSEPQTSYAVLESVLEKVTLFLTWHWPKFDEETGLV